MKFSFLSLAVLSTLLALASPFDNKVQPPAQRPQANAFPVQFRDVTRQAGILFQHNNGGFGKKYLPETHRSGCAFLDYNNDGWEDILLINGTDWAGHKRRTSYSALYRNNKDGTFTDVTREAGLAVEMYGMGCAIGDYDNDGFVDIYVSALGPDHLFRNLGNGRFTDVTQKSKLGNAEFGASCAWVDYDKDGDLDLYVCNYVQWSAETDIFCTLDGVNKSYCTPESYKGASARLWRNRGNGRFEDATSKSGLFDSTSKTLGIAVLDSNNDLWPDLLLANDTQPNRLYINNSKGGFTERGVPAGVAFSEEGIPRAGMGADAADYDRSGYPSIMITNFANQMLALYHNEGNGLFVDEAPRSAVGRASLLTLGFGCFFFDYDLDGWLDIFVANGHIERDIERIQTRIKYAQPPHVFRNTGKGSFEEVTQTLGPAMRQPRVARGAAFGDYDNDGDLDVVIATNGGPAVLLRNDGGTNRGLRLRLTGTRSNRDGLGAVVRVTAGGQTQTQMLRSGSSYLSQSERILTFGLGAQTQADAVEIRWPSGQVDRMVNVKLGGVVTVVEKP